MALGNVLPSYLTAEVDPRAEANIARFERLGTNAYRNIAAAARGANMTLGTAMAGANTRNLLVAPGAVRQVREVGAAATQTRTQLEQTRRAVRGTTEDVSRMSTAFNRAGQAINIVQGPLGPIAGRLSAIGTAVRTLSGLSLTGVLSGAGAFSIAGLANQYTVLESRLRPLYDSQRQVNDAMGEVEAIAKRTRQALDPVADLYAKLTVTGREIGVGPERISRITETVSKAVALSGGSTISREAGLTQFAQGFATNLGGDELRSVRENTLRLARAIADGLGVTTGQLKQLGSQGVLTGEVLARALERSAERIDAEFKKLPPTISSSLTLLSNEATSSAAKIDRAFGFTEKLALLLAGLADNLDKVAIAATAAGGAIAGAKLAGVASSLGGKAGGIGTSLLAGANMALLSRGATPGEKDSLTRVKALSTAVAAGVPVWRGYENAANMANRATVSVGASMLRSVGTMGLLRAAGGSLITLVGGPWAIAFGVLAGAIAYFATRTSDAERATNGAAEALRTYGTLVDSTTGKIKSMSAAQRDAVVARATNDNTSSTSRILQIRQTLANRLERLPGVAGNPFGEQAANIRRGGQAAADAINQISAAAQRGSPELKKYLEDTRDLRTELKGEAGIQAKARDTLRLARGGTDASFTEQQTQAEAEFASKVEQGNKALIERVRTTNTLDDNARRAKNLAEARTALGIPEEPIQIAKNRLEFLRTAPIEAGQQRNRADAIKAASSELAILTRREQQYLPIAQQRAEELTRSETAQRDHNRELSAGTKATAEAERAEKQRLATVEKLADLERTRADVLGRYTAEPDFLQRAEADIRRLRDQVGDILPDGSKNPYKASDALRDEQTIRADINRQVREGLTLNERELQIQEAQIRGDETRAEYLRQRDAFERQFGATLAAQHDAEIRANADRAVQMQRRIEDASRVVSIYTSVAGELRSTFESVWDGLGDRGINTAKDVANAFVTNFRRLKGRILSEQIFGGLERDIEAQIRGTPTTSTAGDAGSTISSAARIFGVDSSQSPAVAAAQTGAAVEKGTAELTKALERNSDATNGSVDGMIAVGDAMLRASAIAAATAGVAVGPGGAVTQKPGMPSAAEAYNKLGKDFGTKLDRIFGTDPSIAAQRAAGAKPAQGLFEGLGAKLGTALEGANYGRMAASITDPLAKAVGLRTSKTGAQVGGAIGNMVGGPIGAAIGGSLGSIAGGLFKKAAKSAATLAFGNGGVDVGTVTGSSASRIDTAKGLAGAVGSQIDRIADAVGGAIGSAKLSIGTRDGKFVVDTTGTNRTKGYGTTKFKTEEEAIAFALESALSQGVIQGISAASDRILRSGQDLNKAIEKAALIESIPRRLLALTDPTKAAITELNRGYTDVINAMIEGGATASQWADAQKLYELERADAIETATKRIDDTFDRYLSDASVDEKLSRTTRLGNARNTLAGFEGAIATGQKVDADKLVEAAETFKEIAGERNSRSAYFADAAYADDLVRRAKANVPDQVTGVLPSSPFETNAGAKNAIEQALAANARAAELQAGILTNGFGSVVTSVDELARALMAVFQPGGSNRDGALGLLPGMIQQK